MFEDGVGGDPGLGEVPDPAHACAGSLSSGTHAPASGDGLDDRPGPDAVIALADDLLAVARTLAQSVAETADLGAQRARVLGRLDQLTGVVATVRGRLLLDERAAERWQRPGTPSFEAARSALSRSGLGAARHEVRQAEALAALPAVADAVGAGVVPVGHLDVIARVIAEASPQMNELLASPPGQATLVGMACDQDRPTFSRELARWVAAQDRARHEDDHQAQRRERFLHLSDQADGTQIRGRLDRMTGHVLRLALEAVGEAPGPDRSPEQARADALGALAQKVLALPETGSGAAVRPHVSLILSERTWVGLRALHADRGESGESGESGGRGAHAGQGEAGAHGDYRERGDLTAGGGARVPAAFPPPTLEDGTPVPSSEALRILCDCDVTRIVVDAESQPVDLGRTQRLYTGVQRRAVIARDRGCIWPGCGKPARWCEIHHIRWWERDGGATSVENGALLCVFHHHEIHRYDMSIERVPVGVGLREHSAGGAGQRYVFRLPDGSVVGESGTSASASAPAPAPAGFVGGAASGEMRSGGERSSDEHVVNGAPGGPAWAPPDRPPGRALQPTGPPGRSAAPTAPPVRAQAGRSAAAAAQPSLDLDLDVDLDVDLDLTS